MSASLQELQELTDRILVLLGQRLTTGRIEIHYQESHLSGVHVLNVYRPRTGPRHAIRVDGAGE